MSTIAIEVQGVGDIAPITTFRDCQLDTAANGEAGSGTLYVRDFGDHAIDWKMGSRLDVKVDGDPVWTGYLRKASRQFWFPVDDPDRLHRRWKLSCDDLNVLFSNRYCVNKDDPNTPGPLYESDTSDLDALDELFSKWLTLNPDGIDTETRVHSVGLINRDQHYSPWGPGWSWGQAMKNVAAFEGAIYYLDAERCLVYDEVDRVTAPFGLSDHPGGNLHSYKDMTIWDDGSDLANNVFGYGFALGLDHVVAYRVNSSGSVDTHGLWQEGIIAYDVWKRDTIRLNVSTFLNGTRGYNLRGHKNNVVSVDLTTDDGAGLRCGQVVEFHSRLWDFDDTLPIRRMTITFPSPTRVRYQMKLSTALLEYEFRDPPLIPHVRLPVDMPTELDGAENTVIIDSFNGRTVGPDGIWGCANDDDGVATGRCWQEGGCGT